MQQALKNSQEIPPETRALVEQVQQLQTIDQFPAQLADLKTQYPALWEQNTPIGLVYGGATKIKGYVFESAKLQDIRGASALLDRINLTDLPAFFGETKNVLSQDDCDQVRVWLDQHFPGREGAPKLSDALIPELVIYSTGGNILAFCPAAFVHELSDAIERRYTEETLTANSCAVGHTFRLLEIRFGLLQDPIDQTPWLDWYHQAHTNPLVQAYFHNPDQLPPNKVFANRKSFNELVGKLAS
ncbi:hypothetical protein [Anthocerotibacter panamensis]|uniref:hypothetical protein n=1 Tax=Anthocerotibacter panamensis TaxID=2857077 RepID=UPI001C401FF1|nr:hypothetical protein [Anthocerotibacter panamensis]